MLAAGDQLQNYRVLRLLGKGGMGEVYLGEDTFLQRMVAIKELSHSLTYDEGFIQRFRREAQLQARLNHPSIVDLYSFFEERGAYYMVMEYAQGKTLRDLIQEIGPIPSARSVSILKQILEALDYAHSMQIIHRDIKPSNIMLDTQDRVKILDFGISRIMGEKGLTSTGQAIGTVYYMSPEQVQAVGDLDGRSDIYSLGVTFFEMLSGRLPYDVNTNSDFMVMEQIVKAPIPDPRDYYPSIAERTVIIMNKMLAKDRDHRYNNAREVICDLEADRPVNIALQSHQTQSGQINPSFEIPQHPASIKTYMTQAILVTLFCCLPFGISAIVYASKVSSSLKAGDYNSAMSYSQKAKNRVLWAFWIGLAYLVIYIIMMPSNI